ncbi:MAG: CHASE2 domain-containing serine/threonine-protein kinase [Oceanococcus sp.]
MSRDWFAGGLFCLLFLIIVYLIFPATSGSWERQAYDAGIALNDRSPSADIAVIAIDDQSVENLGRWPWPRSLHADMIDKLQAAGARVIGNTIFYPEAQTDPGQLEIEVLLKQVEADRNNNPADSTLNKISADMQAALIRLDSDQRLADSYKSSGRVAQAFGFEPGYLRGRPDPSPISLQKSRIETSADIDVLPAQRLFPTIEVLAQHAAIQGHITTLLDIDGVQRSEALAVRYFDEFYPSLSLAIAAQYLNLTSADINIAPKQVEMGGLRIGTTADLRMLNHYYQGDGNLAAFDIDSFFDVLVDNIPAEKYRGKVVIIGATATGIGDRLATPISNATSPAEIIAHTVASILSEDFYTKPAWASIMTLLALVAAIVWVCFGIPLLGAGLAALISVVAVALLVTCNVVLLASSALWVPLTTPAVLLVAGHVFMTIKSLRVTEALRANSEMESAESNRMLGAAFQNQGQLDMAFEKFRRCPKDENVLDPLYTLAQDYERKRQFNKAISAYDYILDINPQYRDATARAERARKLNDTVMLGGAVGAGTLMMSGEDMEKPMLGRYEVQKEIGKGAMGVVYLGKDPKIGRTVAIKTMALSQEFEADELDEVKERFFREAETAGRLTHPNIVTIYDAGEEHDLAFIAMEFINGYDLTDHIKPGKLLDVKTVLSLIADAADALDYAHSQNVIHRDIKPANLMWLPEEKKVKITDFGIARLTDSSKTKTGMVLGTPSYMSPEQLAGTKVDGRSDLFSLGVTLYQMLSGKLPFRGDSMATLMFKIANEQHTPIGDSVDGLDPRIDKVISNALAKDRERRYKKGADFSRHLRILMK